MSGPEIVVREASVGDAAVLAEVGATSFREAYGPHSSIDDLEAHIGKHFTQASIQAQMAEAGQHYRLATVDGVPAGLAKYRQAPCPGHADKKDAIELQQLYVLNAMQRLGLGRCLLQPVINAAETARSSGVWLSVWENADWAIAFYEKNGFAKIGNTEFALGDMIHTDWLMWRPN